MNGRSGCLGLILLLWAPSLSVAAQQPPSRAAILVGTAAPDLERFAARELSGYLVKLFGIRTYPARHISGPAEAVFLVGSSVTNLRVKEATARQGFPELSDQGIVLRRTDWKGRPALVVGGGSPRATLWAVYELAERWGVRYLVDRDLLPERQAFRMPDLDFVMEPVFRIRAFPSIQDYAPSGESWGIDDFRILIDQLAKMKFNRVNIYPFAYQPYLTWEYRGVERRSGTLWYDYHYPITKNMVGQELFRDLPEFWNADLPIKPNTPELIDAGVRQVHLLMEHAHRRGMECAIGAPVLDFPPEFAPFIKGAQPHQGGLTVAPGPETPLHDPGLFDLAAAVIRATVNTYPEADLVTVWVPEQRKWGEQYERVWKELDANYGVGRSYSLEEALAAAEERERKKWHPPAQRPVYQVKSDLAGLYFIDRLLKDPELLQGTRRSDMRFMIHDLTEELFPVLDRILTYGLEAGGMPDKCVSRYAERGKRLQQIPSSFTLDLTFDDDVMGMVPQLTTGAIHSLLVELRRYGVSLSGFVARQRFPADHDTGLAYLSRAAWDSTATPEVEALALLRVVCGEGGETCAQNMLDAMQEVERVTRILERSPSIRAFAYAVPGMLMRLHWQPALLTDEVGRVRSAYQQALDTARRAQKEATGPGRQLVDFWVGRLAFAVAYTDCVAAVRRGGVAEAAQNREAAVREAEAALLFLREALEAYSRVARSRSDVAAIAVMNEYGCRALKTKITELQTEGNRQP